MPTFACAHTEPTPVWCRPCVKYLLAPPLYHISHAVMLLCTYNRQPVHCTSTSFIRVPQEENQLHPLGRLRFIPDESPAALRCLLLEASLSQPPPLPPPSIPPYPPNRPLFIIYLLADGHKALAPSARCLLKASLPYFYAAPLLSVHGAPPWPASLFLPGGWLALYGRQL